MENKPIVTCHGDQNLFTRLHPSVVQGLPREPVEWRRSYGRPPRTVYVETNFVPFNPEILPSDEDWTLLGRPFFHTFWTDCDVDTYKSTVKEDINEWLTILKSKGITEWMIVVVVNDESKVKTKILRQSVFDKVKSDFCGKQTDRCIVLTEPFKADSKSAESWGTMLSRVRQLLLQSYNKNLGKFEDNMRTQRERRVEAGWNFCQFFLLQEELAFMFEMLGLYEDSLVQYDELDALFTQFLLNHVAGDTSEWIYQIKENACTTWDGLSLSQPINVEKRNMVKQNESSLLDFRNFLFSRQCTLLFLMFRPWEVAQRSIPFMHNCIKELDMLEITMPKGSMACWVFLSCLEVLRTCEKFNDSGHMETYSLHTASLWDYARKKMHSIGELCGLLPGFEPTSEQLNMVVDLIAGLGPKEGEIGDPLTKLREALSSKESFRKHYMELSELAMGTFKHIGRIRSARLIGKDLATFYMKVGEPQKAEGFLMDALKTFKEEGWDMLADYTRLEIAECQKILQNDPRYAKTCVYLAASQVLEDKSRLEYQEQMLEISKRCSVDPPIQLQIRPVFLVETITADTDQMIINKTFSFNLRLNLCLLEGVRCERISVSVVYESDAAARSSDPAQLRRASVQSQQSQRSRHLSVSSTSGIDFYNLETEATTNASRALDISEHFEMKPDNKTVQQCGVACKTPLRRMDSGSKSFKELEVCKEESDLELSANDVDLKPGTNAVQLSGKMEEKGTYQLRQLCIKLNGLEFLKSFSKEQISFSVICDEPSIILTPKSEELLTGVLNSVCLSLQTGSSEFPEGTTLKLHPSQGLTISGDSLKNNTLTIPPANTYEEVKFDINLYAELDRINSLEIQHEMTIESSEVIGTVTPRFNFKNPLSISNKLHTAGKKKFVQVVVQGTTKGAFLLSGQNTSCDSKDVDLVAMNPASQKLVVNENQSASYLWQLNNNISETPNLSATFTLNYQTSTIDGDASGDSYSCHYEFTISEYKTLLHARVTVSPPEGQDRCKVGVMSKMELCVQGLSDLIREEEQLMYRVETDPNHWAVTGRVDGVFSLSGKVYETDLQVMPLIAGHLLVPRISIVKYSSIHDDEQNCENAGTIDDDSENQENEGEVVNNKELGDKKDVDDDVVERFATGQVYCASSGTQVHVLPSPNTSGIDVSTA